MTNSATVEVMVRDVVYQAALLRARSQAQQLATVAREILFDRAALAQPSPNVVAPAPRVLMYSDSTRKRFRFQVKRNAYNDARNRLHASGVSVTAVIEEGLETFARTGEFKTYTHTN